MAEEGDKPQPPERSEPPDYTVYKSRPRLIDRIRKPDLSGLTGKLKRGGDGDEPPKPPVSPDERPWWRRALKWVGLFALGWILLSFLAFAISAQIQKSKLADGVGDVLDGNPFMLVSPQTILVLGTDVRSGAFAGPDEAESKNCIDAITSGKGSDRNCKNNPFRSDTIMLIRAGAGSFRKLSIPRDTLAEIPGQGPQKINSAYAAGGAKLTVRTVEGLLGLDVDQVAIIDFDGFRSFIDTIGGIDVDLPTDVCTSVSDGAFNLDLEQGEVHLDGFQAITLARTRINECPSEGFSGGDVERAQFQQLILDGIKGKLTSITAIPMNFIKGPLIGWNAPKAMVSSMGALNMPQLVLSAAIGGGGTDVLEPSSTTAAGNLVVSPEECERAAEKLLDEKPPRKPNCPQG
jgi:LCP family protein required for cell wall assembly